MDEAHLMNVVQGCQDLPEEGASFPLLQESRGIKSAPLSYCVCVITPI